jgi:hypothetical protein
LGANGAAPQWYDANGDILKKLANIVVVALIVVGSARADDDCAVEISMFERDVRVARERNERFAWQLVGANYRRRVARYCGGDERREVFARLNLTDDELKLMGCPRE